MKWGRQEIRKNLGKTEVAMVKRFSPLMGNFTGKSLSDIPRCVKISFTLLHVGSWLLLCKEGSAVVDSANVEHWRLFNKKINTRQ